MSEERIMDRVQKLLNQALDNGATEAEKETFLAKAQDLMRQHSISQLDLDERGKVRKGSASLSRPIVRDVGVFGHGDTAIDREVRDAMHRLFYSLTHHFEVRIAPYRMNNDIPINHIRILGFEADLDFLEMVYTNIKLHMALNLNPRADPERPWPESVANFKNTGAKWEDIHREMQSHPDYPMRGTPWSKSVGLRMYGVYKKITPPEKYVGTSSPNTWRSDFIEGYVEGIRNRLLKMKADETMRDQESGGLLPALVASKEDAIQDLLWDLYPEAKPHESDCVCDRCEERRRAAREWERKNKNKPVRIPKTRVRYRDESAMAAGAHRAQTADLTGRDPKVTGGSSGELGS